MRAQAAKNDDVIIARDSQTKEQKIIAALRLCPYEDSWLLRSMSVDQEYQRRGIGLKMLLENQLTLKDKACYCFPYRHLQDFYQQAGFQLIHTDKASPVIQQLFQQYIDSGKDIILMQMVSD